MTRLTRDNRVAVSKAITQFCKMAGEPQPYQPYRHTGVAYAYPVLVGQALIDIWKFHDHMNSLSWPAMVEKIARVTGPTMTTVTLMALAYGLYEGWETYIRKHGAIPVDKHAYWYAIMNNDDLENVVLTQEF